MMKAGAKGNYLVQNHEAVRTNECSVVYSLWAVTVGHDSDL
jgi:hypothetical protein